MGAIPTLSRVDAGALELVRSFGVEVVSSGDLVQRFLCRWDEAQVASHRHALAAIDAAKDAAFARIGEAHRRSEEPLETEVQAFLVQRFDEAGLTTDHPPIVAVNGHAGDPHYAPSAATPTPIRRGDTVLIDLWAKGTGPRDVFADITWVGFCGDRPPARLEEIFRGHRRGARPGALGPGAGPPDGPDPARLRGGPGGAQPHRREGIRGAVRPPDRPLHRDPRPRRRRQPGRPGDPRRPAAGDRARLLHRAGHLPAGGGAGGAAARSTCSWRRTGRPSSAPSSASW